MYSRGKRPTTSDQRLIARLREHGPCSWLLLALLLLMVAMPFLDTSLMGRLLLGALNSVVLVACVLAASQSGRALIIAVALALPALGLQWASAVAGHPHIELVLALTMMLFYTYTIAYLVAFVLQPGPVTGNKLHGAIGAYILIGLLWTTLYTLIEVLSPGAFVFPRYTDQGNHHWPQLLFFSFTTLTTTGYGDTIPTAGHAQTAVILEQLAGTFYVAILIARLAGLYQPESHGHRSDDHS